MEIIIRLTSDINHIEKCARLMSLSDPWKTLNRTFEDSVRMLSDPDKELYIGTVRDETVGFILLDMRGILSGYIQSIGVFSEWRNKGTGTVLIRYAEERIFRESPNVFICVSSFNKDAQRLYEKLGYHVIGNLRDFIVNGHSEILLRKTVSAWHDFKSSEEKYSG